MKLPAFVAVSIFLVAGCGGVKYDSARPAGGQSRIAMGGASRSSTHLETQRLPWEIWPLSYDLDGMALESRLLLEADELLRAGERAKALELYLRLDPARISAREREARAIRVASTQLAVDRAKEALDVLSRHFRSQKKSAQDVDGRFSLIFAYAYGREGDIDQSLAWFSRAARAPLEAHSVRAAGFRESAEEGIRLLLRSLDDERLYGLGERWITDSIVYPLIGQERRRRAVPGYEFLQSSPRFWESGTQSFVSSTEISPLQAGEVVSVGVLLPLSGPFASLGRSMEQGMSLAVEAHEAQEGRKIVSLEVRDDAGDAIQAAALARELVTAGGVSMIAGPLLTDPALRVSEIARLEAKPMLAFSKSSVFQTGDGIFRLGPTPESQVASLVDVVTRHLGLTKLALVYPFDPAGEEFARIFRSEMMSRGLDIVLDRGYPRDDSEAKLAISKEIDQLPVQGIFFPDSLKAATRFFAYLGTDPLRSKPRPLGTASWDNALELQQSRAILDGAVYVAPFLPSSAHPLTARFVEAYRAKFGVEPDFMAAQGYDAATLIVRGAAHARAEGVPLEQSLRQLGAYEGLTGLISVQASGELARQFPVVTFQGGRVSEVITAVPAEEDTAARSLVIDDRIGEESGKI